MVVNFRIANQFRPVRPGKWWQRMFLAALLCSAAGRMLSAQPPPIDPRLAPYLERADNAAQPEAPEFTGRPQLVIPHDFVPWWNQAAFQPLSGAPQSIGFGAEDLVLRALRHSAQVRVISDTPLIQQTAITVAAADFDVRQFLETRWLDTSEPIGNLLTAGAGRSRYLDRNWTTAGGLRKRTEYGGQYELAQRFGMQETNSQFFVPGQQGTSQLALSFTQPLLRGAGFAYNTSTIVLAEIDADAAMDEFSRQLQQYLVDVYQAYWVLYLERTALLQRQELYREGEKILKYLEDLHDVDALQSQILNARARVARRRADVIRSQQAVRNAEAQIRALVNDPEFVIGHPLELIPRQLPGHDPIHISLNDALTTALQFRPEISQALKSIQAAAVRAEVSEQELLPKLDLILETYVKGLDGRFAYDDAFGNQFGTGRPSYSFALQFEMPLGNHAARARLERQRLELRQLTNRMRVAVEELMAEVEVAVRQVDTSYRQMQSMYHSMLASRAELEDLYLRWKLLPGEGEFASIVLQNLLDNQERLAETEFGFAQAKVGYNLALIKVKQTQGTLLRINDQLPIGYVFEHGLPTMVLQGPTENTGAAPPP
jgi:outer membrane protein